MDARKGNIYEILNGNKQFLIPVYQRFYSWDIDQCKRLWNDIVEMQRKDKVGHFVGSIVNIAEQAMPTGVQKYMIIDGQQRMTTLTLLLLALRDYAIMNPSDTTINARRIDNMLLKNEYESGDERYKLLLTETDRDVLISLVEEKPIAEGSRSRLIENYNFFAHKLADKEIQPAEVYESIGKLQIVNITLDRAVDDAQAIFESLNSTGKELSESDLIRNYVLMGLEPSEQTYVYEHLWRPMEQLFIYETQGIVMDAFFRHYLTMNWCTDEGNMKLSVIRNAVFAVTGIGVIILYAISGNANDYHMTRMVAAILISFGCYLPVTLFSKTKPKVGLLMIPKTCAYMWIIAMGLQLMF